MIVTDRRSHARDDRIGIHDLRAEAAKVRNLLRDVDAMAPVRGLSSVFHRRHKYRAVTIISGRSSMAEGVGRMSAQIAKP